MAPPASLEYRFEGDPARQLLIFRAVGAPHVLRARIFQGPYSREIWQALMSLNNAQNRPSRPVDAFLPKSFEHTDNTGENRRKMVLQPLGSGRTVLEFDQQVPASLPAAIQTALAEVRPLPDPRVPAAAAAALPGDPDHEEHSGERQRLSVRTERQPRPRKRGRRRKPAKSVKLQHPQQRE
jgi:hypothetical protein